MLLFVKHNWLVKKTSKTFQITHFLVYSLAPFTFFHDVLNSLKKVKIIRFLCKLKQNLITLNMKFCLMISCSKISRNNTWLAKKKACCIYAVFIYTVFTYDFQLFRVILI